jgi:phospholipase C
MGDLLRKGVAAALVATLVGIGACDSDRAAKPNPLSAARVADPGRDGDPALRALDHIIVIYLENRSFDNVYGEFAGANGLSSATRAPLQVDGSGNAFATLPAVPGMASIPTNLPNAWNQRSHRHTSGSRNPTP